MKKHPNIVFILVDDLGWKDLSCYGSEYYETPHIDELSRSGLHLTDAYAACPVCSPTRASLLTGKYPARVGITNYIAWRTGVHPSKGLLIDAPYADHLANSEHTIADALKGGGYTTWHVGKWHLGGDPHLPEHHGFDVNIGGCEYGMPINGYFSPWGIPTLPDGPEGEYLTDRMGNEAAGLIRKHSAGNDADRPFFLNLCFYSVHIPIQAKPETIAKYEAKRAFMGIDPGTEFADGGRFPTVQRMEGRIQRRLIQGDPVYAAMVESLDENVGKILAALEETGYADDTVVIFTSDNGGASTSEGAPTCNLPLAEGKGWMYEGGTREPYIIKWPGVTRPGSINTTPISSPDLYPTLLDIAGLDPIPEQHLDGMSFAGLLGSSDPRPPADFAERPLFWHYPHYGNQGGTPGASIRKGDWKLIRFFEDGHEELYNLKQDLSETTNLAKTEPAKREELSRLLTEWAEGIEAIEPEVNPEYVPWADREPCGHFAVEDDGSRGGSGGAGGSSHGSELGPSDPRV